VVVVLRIVPRWFAPHSCRLTQPAAHNAELHGFVA